MNWRWMNPIPAILLAGSIVTLQCWALHQVPPGYIAGTVVGCSIGYLLACGGVR